jgi:hypothetical protein
MVCDETEEGGYKQSCVGRINGSASIDDFIEYKTIVYGSTSTRIPKWRRVGSDKQWFLAGLGAGWVCVLGGRARVAQLLAGEQTYGRRAAVSCVRVLLRTCDSWNAVF